MEILNCGVCRDAESLKRGILNAFYRYVPEPRKSELVRQKIEEAGRTDCADCFIFRGFAEAENTPVIHN